VSEYKERPMYSPDVFVSDPSVVTPSALSAEGLDDGVSGAVGCDGADMARRNVIA